MILWDRLTARIWARFYFFELRSLFFYNSVCLWPFGLVDCVTVIGFTPVVTFCVDSIDEDSSEMEDMTCVV